MLIIFKTLRLVKFKNKLCRLRKYLATNLRVNKRAKRIIEYRNLAKIS